MGVREKEDKGNGGSKYRQFSGEFAVKGTGGMGQSVEVDAASWKGFTSRVM